VRVSIFEEILLKLMLEARGLAFAGLQDFFVGANVAGTNIPAVLLEHIAERGFYIVREKIKLQAREDLA